MKVRLRGVVQAEGAAQQTFRRITLVSGNETLSSVEQGELVLALAEGGVATIEMINEELQLVGATPSIVRGPWSELRARPEAAGLDYNLSAELGDVELHVLSIEPGEPIEVFGETVEHATGDAGRPSRLMAEIVTFGEREDAMRAMTLAISQRKEREHAPRDPKSSSDIIGDPGDPASSPRLLAWLPSGFALLAVILCLVGFAFSHSARIKWELLVNAPMWAAVGLSFRPGLDVPEFRRREKPLWAKGSSQFYVRMVLATGPMMFLVSMTSPPAPYSSNRPILSAPSLLVFSIVFIIGWIASEYVWNGAAHRLHATLGAAPPADADKWGVCEGTVSARRPTTIAGTRAAMGVVTQFKTHMARRRADELMKTTLLARAPFMIETKHGAVAIDPIECVWATTVKATDRADDSKAVLEWVPIGGQIAACGKLVSRQTPAGERALHLTSDGTRAPILLATSAKGHPFALASHIVRQRRITLVGLLAAAAIIGTLAPMMPSP